MIRLAELLQNKATVADEPAAIPTPPSLQSGGSTAAPAARLAAARAELSVIDGLSAEAQRQQDAAIAAGNVREASDQADQISALDRRRDAVLSIETAARRELAKDASQHEWKALEEERAEIVREAGDCGAEMEAHFRVGRQIWQRWETIHARIDAFDRRRISHVARYGAAPEFIPFVDDRGWIEILGITQGLLGSVKRLASELVHMESFREARRNPPQPPEPIRHSRERDKRLGVQMRFRRSGESSPTDIPGPSERAPHGSAWR